MIDRHDVQRRATKMIEGIGGMNYEDRLTELRLTTLETRRIRADLIEVYEIVQGGGSYCKGIGLSMDGGSRRGHCFKMFKKRFRLDVGKYVFSNRVCNWWNDLPGNVVRAGSLDEFKRGVDDYLRNNRGLI